jgi:hypothetical protein
LIIAIRLRGELHEQAVAEHADNISVCVRVFRARGLP